MHYKYTYIYFYNIFNLLVIFLTNFCEILFFFWDTSNYFSQNSSTQID